MVSGFFDICDMYAKAAMYGLGAGIYPKDKLPPTDEFIESIAKKAGVLYTKGKKGEDRFYDDNGNLIYPPNNGAVGKEEKTTLPKGMIISRYGKN